MIKRYEIERLQLVFSDEISGAVPDEKTLFMAREDFRLLASGTMSKSPSFQSLVDIRPQQCVSCGGIWPWAWFQRHNDGSRDVSRIPPFSVNTAMFTS